MFNDIHIKWSSNFRIKEGGNVENSTRTVRILERCDPAKQESLDSENIPDPMDAEQTWPTNEDYEMAEKDRQVGSYCKSAILF